VTSELATRNDWKISEPPSGFTKLQYRDQFTQAEYETIQRGVVPEEMEDKWFIFYEDPILYLHLSWTGSLVYRVTLERDDIGAHVIDAELSAKYEPEPMREEVLPWVIRHVLLRQNVKFPEG
jgi:hypothetical protein